MLAFDENRHAFQLDGVAIPSVTEILSPLQEDSFKMIRPEVLQAAADRGTLVHEITEAIDLDMDYEDLLEPQVMPYVEAYLDFLTEHDVEWDGVEEKVYFQPENAEGWVSYAGIVDRFGMIDGEWAVLDIKTVNSPTIEQKVSVATQLYAYQMAIQQRFALWPQNARHYALYLNKDGKYRLYDTDELCEKDDLEPDRVWYALMASYSWKDEAKRQLMAIKEKHRRKPKNEPEINENPV